jgi:signal transduction histidine kinase
LGRDAAVAQQLLRDGGIPSATCANLLELHAGLSEDTLFAVIADEALRAADLRSLSKWLTQQPTWSDLPFIILTHHSAGSALARDTRRLSEVLGNVTLIERPFHPMTFLSVARTAHKGRLRQYDARARINDLRESEENLERRVAERTDELERAHADIIAHMRQRERAEEKLRQSQKMEMIGQLTGGVAHDFNNLLMVISGSLSLLDRTSDAARRERLVHGIKQAAARAEALTKQLLAFSRRMTLSPQAVDVPSLLEGMSILVAGALREDIEVAVDLEPGLWPVMADPTQLDVAILNIALNARDAMPTGGTLTIRARNEGGGGTCQDNVCIEVRDTGRGIPAEILDRIFEPFFTTKEVGRGTGLGLSQVYGFAQQSGGSVEVLSTPGKGTSVLLRLPRADGTDRRDEPGGSAASDEERPLTTRRVLLVEDNDSVAELVENMLESLGLSVRRVATAAEAIVELDAGGPYELLFSDVVMPGGMTGIELARHVQSSHPHLPVLLTTGYSDALHSASKDGLKLLQKPYRVDALEGVVRELGLL